MRDRLDDPHQLHDLAQSALMSPSHFHRVFTETTAATPGRFLTALRIARAKRLLMETSMTSTEVALAVGYASFGTFTSQFTRLVGLPPGRFRASAARVADLEVSELLGGLPPPDRGCGGLPGRLGVRPDGEPGLAAVGLFPSGLPQELPAVCAVAPSPGPVLLPGVGETASGSIMAVSVRVRALVREVLAERPEAGLCVGSVPSPHLGFHLALRRRRTIDPPVLTAFPLAAMLTA